MGFIDIFKNIFNKKDNNLIKFYLQDNKCGHRMEVLLRKSYDIHRIYNEEDAYYKIDKVIICSKCYNKITISISFDKQYNIVAKKIENGKFITQDEFIN